MAIGPQVRSHDRSYYAVYHTPRLAGAAVNCVTWMWTYNRTHTANLRITHFTHSSTAPFQFTNSRARLQNCTFSQACICCSGCQTWLQTSCIAASEDDLQVFAQEDSLQQYIRTIIDHRPPHPRTLTSPK